MTIAYSLPAMEVKRYMMYIKQCSKCHQPVIGIFYKVTTASQSDNDNNQTNDYEYHAVFIVIEEGTVLMSLLK